MASLFASPEMAEGYARWRPAVHPEVMRLVSDELPRGVRLAVDIGCGAGLSTAALEGFAHSTLGVDPWPEMVARARRVVPGARFVVGGVEHLPVRTGAAGLVSAAGSLNWSELDTAFAEVRRVVQDDGVFLVYDFSEGREFPDSSALTGWFAAFQTRYPPAPALDIGRESLESRWFRVADYREFAVALELEPEFYLEYMLTETNVADAIRRGTPANEIREWCRETIRPVFDGRSREVVFRGWAARLEPA